MVKQRDAIVSSLNGQFVANGALIVIAVTGSYVSASVIGARAPNGYPPDAAAKRWT